MDKLQIGESVDATAELEELLLYNGFSFRREGETFHLVFADRGCKWETMCVCREQLVLFYGRYPFPIVDRERAQTVCGEINRQVVQGSMFLHEDRAVFRTGADLFDAYSAYEHMGRALEYNAGVMVRFWSQMAACAAVNFGDFGNGPVSQMGDLGKEPVS